MLSNVEFKKRKITAFYFRELTINGKIKPALRNQFKDNKTHSATRCQAYSITHMLSGFTGGRDGDELEILGKWPSDGVPFLKKSQESKKQCLQMYLFVGKGYNIAIALK